MRVILFVLFTMFSIASGKPQWKQRILPSAFPFKDAHYSRMAHDRNQNIVYALSHGHIFLFNLNNFTIDSVRIHGESPSGEQFTLDAKHHRLIMGKGGMQIKFEIDINTGLCKILIPHREDEHSHFSALYWNDKLERVGYFGGYGHRRANNWAFEYDQHHNWIQVHENSDDCKPPKRLLSEFVLGHPEKPHLYLVSGLWGNCSGNQQEQQCSNGLSAIGNDLGSWCWLRDVFLYDYEQHTFTTIIGPHEQSITHEGIPAYDYKENTLYIIGGYIPKVRERSLESYISHNSILRLRIGKDKTFHHVPTITKNMNVYSWHDQHNMCAYYNPAKNSLLWFRNDGLWELQLQ